MFSPWHKKPPPSSQLGRDRSGSTGPAPGRPTKLVMHGDGTKKNDGKRWDLSWTKYADFLRHKWRIITTPKFAVKQRKRRLQQDWEEPPKVWFSLTANKSARVEWRILEGWCTKIVISAETRIGDPSTGMGRLANQYGNQSKKWTMKPTIGTWTKLWIWWLKLTHESRVHST